MLDIRDWIAVHAHRTPDATAQIDHATGRRFTYREMDNRVDRLGSYLRHKLGLTQGAVVGVLSPNSSDVLDVDFACARVGSVFFPMNTRLAPPELAYQLNDAAPQVLFVGKGMEALASAALAEAETAPLLIGMAGADLTPTIESIIADAGPLGPVEPRHVDDPWTLIYSSGTTGRPKGIVHSHGMVTAQAVMNCVPLGLNPDCVNLTILPLFHISGLNIFAHPMFYAGGTQVTLEGFNPGEVLQIIGDQDIGISHFCGVPTIFEVLAAQPEFAATDTSSVRGVYVGGAASTLTLLETYANKGMPLIQGYGMTEAGPTITVLNSADAVRKLGSAGKTAMHVDLKILRADNTVCEAGEIGEILIRGPSIISGYFKRPDTQETDFFDGWLRTGDMGHLDEEGFLYLSDRKKDMFISGGENVYPAEIENVLAGIEGIVKAAVVGVPDTTWGEVGAACVILQGDAEISLATIQAACEGKLARYKIPKYLHCFDSLPLGASGKVLKNQLRTQLANNV